VADDNVRALPMGPDAIVRACIQLAESFKPVAVTGPDPELALWDDIVRMRLSTAAMVGRMNPPPVDEAIDAANKVVRARRTFAAEK
jgi:hypothetical protein